MAERPSVRAFRVVAVLHAALAVAQPIAAGALLQASAVGLAVHQAVGDSVLLVGLVLAVLALVARRRGGVPGWTPAVAAGLVLAEGAQIGVGYSGVLALHVPLGVAIVGASVWLAVWAVRAEPEIAPAAPRGR